MSALTTSSHGSNGILGALPKKLKEKTPKSSKAKGKTKKALGAKKDTKRSNSRVVMGWSMPKNNPQAGPKPKCKGCGKAIEKMKNAFVTDVLQTWIQEMALSTCFI